MKHNLDRPRRMCADWKILCHLVQYLGLLPALVGCSGRWWGWSDRELLCHTLLENQFHLIRAIYTVHTLSFPWVQGCGRIFLVVVGGGVNGGAQVVACLKSPTHGQSISHAATTCAPQFTPPLPQPPPKIYCHEPETKGIKGCAQYI